MIKYKLILLFLFMNLINSYCQIPDSVVFKIADSIVLANTDENFLKSLDKKVSSIMRYGNIDEERLIKINTTNTYQPHRDSIVYKVYYSITISEKHGDIWEKYGLYSPVSGIRFIYDSVLYLINEPNFELLIDFRKKLEDNQFITKDTAAKIAQKYFTKKFRRCYRKQLMFDRKSKVFYWAIGCDKGFTKIYEETVKINAFTYEFIEVEPFVHYYSFWMAIENVFF